MILMPVTSDLLPLVLITAPSFGDVQLMHYNDKYQHPKYGYFAMREYHDERILCVDADMYRRAGNIFDYPKGYVYMLDEAFWRRDPNWADQFRDKIAKQAGPVDWDEHWWNPGTTLLDGDMMDWLEMPPWNVNDHLWVTKSSQGKAIVKNMPWINWLIAKNKIPMKQLSPIWNCMAPITNKWAAEARYWHLTQNEHFSVADKINILKVATAKHGAYKPRGALVTVVNGPLFEKMFKITGRRMELKAAEWGMDFIVRRRSNGYPSPAWAKCEYPDGYDFMLFIDCDCLISLMAPNPIIDVPHGFGAFNSFKHPYMRNPSGGAMTSLKKWYRRAYGHRLAHVPFYINSGVWVCWNESKHILNVKQIELDKYFEQHAINVNLWDYPKYIEMDEKWNFGHLHKKDRDPSGVWIAHLNGVKPEERMQYLRNLERLL